MTFASEKLYKGYLRHNLSKFVNTVKPTEIMVHLHCLTDSDRDEIYAKKESRGNYDATVLLLDCLKRREKWPEQLIQALKECEHFQLSQEIEMEYNSLKLPMNGRSAPAGGPSLSPAAPVGGPHPPLASSTGGHTAAPDAPAGVTPAPPATAAPLPLSPALAPPVPSLDAHPSLAPIQRTPEQPALEKFQTVAVTDNLAPQNTQHDSSSVEENILSQRAPLDPVEARNLSTTFRQDLPATPVQPDRSEDHVSSHTNQSLASEALVSTRAGPAASTQLFTVNTPVQETDPPNTGATSVDVDSDPVENSDPTVIQVRDSCQHTEFNQDSAAFQHTSVTTPSTERGQSSNLASSTSSDGATAAEEYLSKPGVLQSHPAQCVPKAPYSMVQSPPAQCAPEAPYSGDMDRLEFSNSQVNSYRPDPQEDHYESFYSSQTVYTNEGHVSEEASIQNYAGQSLDNPRESLIIPPDQKRHNVGGSPKMDSTSYQLLENYYIPAAVVLAACVVVLLWRLRK
ncbi:mitochondrial antiviral-signaling protein [Arapaima gigas]